MLRVRSVVAIAYLTCSNHEEFLLIFFSFLFLLNIAVVMVLLDHHYDHDIEYGIWDSENRTVYLPPFF